MADGWYAPAYSSAAQRKRYESTMIQWRNVTKLEYVGACRYTGYQAKTAQLTLSCGHQLYRKASVPIPEKARCMECERNAPVQIVGSGQA